MTGSNDGPRVDLSVIVVNYNTKHLLPEMMAALESAAAGIALQVIIVDNASRDGSAEYIRATWPTLELIANPVNVGFGRANNQAVPLLRGHNVLLLNTDAFVALGALRVALLILRERRRGLPAKTAAASGLLLMIGKLPQFLGLVRFHRNRVFGRVSELIEYKGQ